MREDVEPFSDIIFGERRRNTHDLIDIYEKYAKRGTVDLLEKIETIMMGSETEGVWCMVAAKYNRTLFLEYMQKHWDENTSMYAALYGNIDCLRYLLERGCPMNAENICSNIAYVNSEQSTEAIKLVHKYGAILDEKACVYSIMKGNLELFKFIVENSHLPEDAVIVAIKYDCLDVLEYIHERVGFDSYALEYAALHDRYECFVYIHSRGQKITSGICEAAATSGSIRILRYIYRNTDDVKWSADTYKFADKKCRKFLKETSSDCVIL